MGDGVDYIEIYNRSCKDHCILKNWSLASVKHSPPDLPDTQSVDITASCRALFPAEYLVLDSRSAKWSKDQYYTADPEAFLKWPSFPSYNNDLGSVLLTETGREL
ncbi:MAG: hypothetical protein MZV49_05040 [Rhodopseudomonas palustris]|nr:hypothetical protein [Rhodopseudomonas palustris]